VIEQPRADRFAPARSLCASLAKLSIMEGQALLDQTGAVLTPAPGRPRVLTVETGEGHAKRRFHGRVLEASDTVLPITLVLNRER